MAVRHALAALAAAATAAGALFSALSAASADELLWARLADCAGERGQGLFIYARGDPTYGAIETVMLSDVCWEPEAGRITAAESGSGFALAARSGLSETWSRPGPPLVVPDDVMIGLEHSGGPLEPGVAWLAEPSLDLRSVHWMLSPGLQLVQAPPPAQLLAHVGGALWDGPVTPGRWVGRLGARTLQSGAEQAGFTGVELEHGFSAEAVNGAFHLRLDPLAEDSHLGSAELEFTLTSDGGFLTGDGRIAAENRPEVLAATGWSRAEARMTGLIGRAVGPGAREFHAVAVLDGPFTAPDGSVRDLRWIVWLRAARG